MENIAEEINQTPKEKIFDPDLFIKENYCQKEEKNYPKYNLSIEDLEYNYNNKEENFFKEQELIETKEHEGKKFLNEIFQEKNLNKQKIEIHNLIGKIKKMNIKKILEINSNKKLNIVFDLDNTCICGFIVFIVNYE